jgi:hypothetical protein
VGEDAVGKFGSKGGEWAAGAFFIFHFPFSIFDFSPLTIRH